MKKAQARAPWALVGLLLASAAAATERSTVLMLGKVAGYQQVEYLPPGEVKVHFEFTDRGRGPVLDSTYLVNEDGSVAAAETRGHDYFKVPVAESYTASGSSRRWKNSAEDEQREVAGPAFYLSLESGPEEYVLLTRAALKAPGQRLALLPSGEVQVAAVGTYTLKGKAGSRKVRLYSLSGLDLTPSYLWLDEQQRFFASYSSWVSTVREGFEDTLEQIGKHQEADRKSVV